MASELKIDWKPSSDFQCHSRWRSMVYSEGSNALFFQIEPMATGPDIVYTPDQNKFQEAAPAWARSRYAEILGRMKAATFNRRLQWDVSAHSAVLEGMPVTIPGSLEATKGGSWLESENLFERDDLTHEQVHDLWHRLIERFVDACSGVVTVYESDVVKNSVFQEIELPRLRQNPRVTIDLRR